MFAANSLRTLVRRSAIATATISATGVGSAAIYANTEKGNGFKRELVFWSKVFPVVADYYIRTARKSPLVQWQKLTKSGIYENASNDTEIDDETLKKRRKELIQSLHEKHAPEIYNVMLELKGLYIKLGQVLSVTALPIPETYRVLFRTLQSDVPGHEEFETIVKPMLEKEFGKPLDHIFEHIDESPCGAASIGQAHRAVLKEAREHEDRDVIVKVQYPDASWQVPADIECVGDFLKICVWADVVDEQSSKLSYDEFSRQFLSELDYNQEMKNLKTVYESSIDPNAPYIKNNVVLPKVYQDYCTSKVITMSYLNGVSMESEARRQLELLGIDTSGGIGRIIKDAAKDAAENPNNESGELVRRVTRKIDPTSKSPFSWKASASRIAGKFLSVDSVLLSVRTGKKIILWYQSVLVTILQKSPEYLVSSSWQDWAEKHSTAAAQIERLGEIDAWCKALFDVHGHQVFNLGVFNADCHPGNILLGTDGAGKSRIGLIDYGQCKHLNEEEQYKVARLILSVANNEPDENIAKAFRDLDIKTLNDSTEFLAMFSKLMFGPFKPEHMQHSWHQNLHKMDRVLYFPKELSMVYRTSLLLRGLAVSLQLNYSIGEQWKGHAQEAVDRYQKKHSLVRNSVQ